MADDGFVVVYTGTAIEAGLARGLLEEAGIKAFVQDEFMGTMAPWYVTPGGLAAVKVLVSSADAEHAEPLIAAFLEEDYHE